MFTRLLLYGALSLARTPSNKIQRMEKLVEYNLRERVDKKMCYRLINGFILEDEFHLTHFINHIVINNNGIFIIHTIDVEGEISGKINEQYWKLDNDDFANPLLYANKEAEILMSKLKDKNPVYPVMLFINGNKNHTGIETVVNLDELPRLLDTYHVEGMRTYSRDEVIKIYEEIKALYYSQPSLNQHMKNMERMKNGLENNICPLCGSSLKYEMDNYGYRYLRCTSYKCPYRILK